MSPVNQLIEDGIMAKSYSSWKFHPLVALKKVDSDGKTKWRLLVYFPKLNEKIVGEAYPYLISLKFWTSCFSLNIFHA
jgi:hypothetical protein